jgi:hypothetical protein
MFHFAATETPLKGELSAFRKNRWQKILAATLKPPLDELSVHFSKSSW